MRRYRSWMAEERFAFLVPDVEHASVPRIAYHAVENAVVQEWRLDGRGSVTFRVRGRLAPPALLEITEVSPLEPLLAETAFSAAGTTLELSAPALPACARIAVDAAGAEISGWRLLDDVATLTATCDGPLELRVTATLADGRCGESPQRPSPAGVRRWTRHAGRLWVDDVPAHVLPRHREALSRIADGAVRYVSGCTALRVAPGETCLLTDHRLLPLSWTRDAYYQALLLLAAREPRHLEIVADHLRWLFGRCRREAGVWQRSHRPNGEPKDMVYQADQQLYPVLELLDFRDSTGLWPDPPRGREWGELVDEVWTGLPLSPDGLVPTEENAADDPALPYALSTQILLWYTTSRLATVAAELGLDGAALADSAARTHDAVGRAFAVEGPEGSQWAYEVDGDGAARLYHDANDLPTAFAPIWRFCAVDDRRWLATMLFAFGEANPGYRPGRWGGLGSLHTPGTWPLGDLQEWVAASIAAERALDRLTGVASADGLLPETYDPATGAWTARHWFAWPAAAVGALALARLAQA